MSDNHIKAHDDAVRADERAKLAKIHERVRDLLNKADILLIDIMGKTGQATNGSAPRVKAKRKPVAVTMDKVGAVAELLGTEALPIKGFRVPDMSARKVGVALRFLVDQGKAIEQPRGKFRAVAQPAAADGAGE